MFKDEIETIEYDLVDGTTVDKQQLRRLCDFAFQHAKERPQLKPVDLSVLIESGIDCEFDEDEGFTCPIASKLTMVACPDGPRYVASNNRGYSYVRPRMNHVHAWGVSRSCPLPEGLSIRCHFRGGGQASGDVYLPARWNNMSASTDIIAFEILGLADGWCWPWKVSNE